MIANYQLNTKEIDDNFIKNIKRLFKDKEINIVISEISDYEYLSKTPGMIDSIKEGINEPTDKCSSIDDLGW